MALYPKSQESLSEELFLNPTSEYRAAPFWAWNCEMTPEKISRMAEMFEQMGMGGAHIHSRTGMSTPYLSEEYFALVKDAHEKFRKRGMLTWLYDEDRWPSGFAGGLVTKEEKHRARFLVFAPERLEGKRTEDLRTGAGPSSRSDKRRLLARYEVRLNEGFLESYRLLKEHEKARKGSTEWFAYLEISGSTPRFNNQAYMNTLDKSSVERFVEVTHEKYKEVLGTEFGKTIPAIFTDEPQFSHKTRLHYASDRMEVMIPYTDDLEETFQETYGHSLLASLPELFWERKEEMVSQIRYEYHDHICERFASAYADTLGEWCEKNNILLTGHMMEEPTLKSQTTALGEAMRSYRSFGMPGIDMLCDWRELSTAKQAQSASHQYGREGVLSELYGVTNWDFDFRGHKLQGDWQAALGVTVRVPHLSWTSMAGESKRDYPASIGYQSPWYQEYRYLENYFARINTFLTRGTANVRIGVIHPIESYWLYWGSEEKTGEIRTQMEKNFEDLIHWLLYGHQDFDFICESLLPKLNQIEEIDSGSFAVGKMKYQVVIVPNCVTLRKSTLERLKVWSDHGGKVIFAGEIPSYIEAIPSQEGKKLAEKCIQVPFAQGALLEVLEEEKVLNIRTKEGLRADNLIYQLRNDGENRILFLAHVEKMKNPDLPKREEVTISLRGTWAVSSFEPLDGTKKELPVKYQNGKTMIERSIYDHDSLLLYLTPADAGNNVENVSKATAAKWKTHCTKQVVPVTLSEPNVLVLDMAEYAFDDGEWQPQEELLRLDNQFRSVLGYPPRENKIAQPWTEQTEETPEHTLFLRFKIQSQLEVKNVRIALENKSAVLIFNGNEISVNPNGWYVDEDIFCCELGTIRRGVNELIVKIPYYRKENIENFFLLGDFGVHAFGAEAVITEPVRELAFGDYTVQGLPFYGGNVTYHLPIFMPEDGILKIEATRFRNPLLKAVLDGKQEKIIAFSPYIQTFECCAGKHMLELVAFGNRRNTFGALHNCNEKEQWFGPTAWRSEGAAWSYEYQIKPCGILKTPLISTTAISG